MFSRLRSILGRKIEEHEETGVRKDGGLRSHRKTWRIRWSWGRHKTTGEAPSQISSFTKQNQQMDKVQELTVKLKSIEYEQIELSEMLDCYTRMDLDNRLKSFEKMKKDYEQVMSDLQKMPQEIRDSVNKCKQLMKENNETYSYIHRIGLPDLTQLKNNVHVLRLSNEKLLEEQMALQETCEEVNKLFKEIQEKICDSYPEQHQQEEILDERPKNLLNQKEQITQQRQLAEKMKHPFKVLEKRSKTLQSDLEPAPSQDESLLQTELLGQVH